MKQNGVVCLPGPALLFFLFRFEYLISGPKWNYITTMLELLPCMYSSDASGCFLSPFGLKLGKCLNPFFDSCTIRL